jgi:DNA-binding response OmpR family regulator
MDESKRRILVIDDDGPTLEVISLLFQMEGYEVAVLQDCGGLNDLLETFKPHIVLMDVMIGSLDGRDACREFKNSEHRHIPLILMSVIYRFHEDLTKPLFSDDYIEKPFDLEVLLEKVQVLLNR